MKINRKQCIYDFIVEIIFGTIFIISIIVQKTPFAISFDFPVILGLGAFIYYFIRKRDLDERDYYLYYRINHLTLGFMILTIGIPRIFNFQFFDQYWASFIMSAFFFFHGSVGLIYFIKK